MAIKTTRKEKAAGGLRPTMATVITDLGFPTKQLCDKEFYTLRAASALQGHALHRSGPTDGPETYWVESSGLVRYVQATDKARQFLEKIGGRL